MKNAFMRLVSVYICNIRYSCMQAFGLYIHEPVLSLTPLMNGLFVSYERLFISCPEAPHRKFPVGPGWVICRLFPLTLQAQRVRYLTNRKPGWPLPVCTSFNTIYPIPPLQPLPKPYLWQQLYLPVRLQPVKRMLPALLPSFALILQRWSAVWRYYSCLRPACLRKPQHLITQVQS